MICEKCGQNVEGLMQWVDHPCNRQVIEHRPYTDNEMRNAFLELGMPNMGFEAMGYAKPTEMERRIFERPEPEEEPEPPRSAEEIAFDAVFQKMTPDEQMQLLMLSSAGFTQGNMQIMGYASHERLQKFREEMRQKYL